MGTGVAEADKGGRGGARLSLDAGDNGTELRPATGGNLARLGATGVTLDGVMP